MPFISRCIELTCNTQTTHENTREPVEQHVNGKRAQPQLQSPSLVQLSVADGRANCRAATATTHKWIYISRSRVAGQDGGHEPRTGSPGRHYLTGYQQRADLTRHSQRLALDLSLCLSRAKIMYDANQGW